MAVHDNEKEWKETFGERKMNGNNREKERERWMEIIGNLKHAVVAKGNNRGNKDREDEERKADE